MSVRLDAVSFAAHDPRALAGFWAGLLRTDGVEDVDGAYALPLSDVLGFRVRFVPSDAPKLQQNRAHFDLRSESLDDQRQTVDRALALGGRHVDVGQLPEEEHVVLGDPEGNEFCVIEPGNAFLADCPVVGALACDGLEQVGRFWSVALGWPLVWDQDGETAIRSATGGSIISWGGPPLPPRLGPDRVHLDVVAGSGSDAEFLVGLGAVRADFLACHEGVPLVDPDGNAFCLSAVG